MLPNFLIVGAAKCGTSALTHYLDQHPSIFMSQPKEPPFFAIEYDKGIEYYQTKYFSQWAKEKFVGDAAHRNLLLPYVPQRIADALGSPKLIALVRNPIDRAYSHFWDDHTHGVRKLSFEESLKLDLAQLERGPRFTTESEYRSALNATEHTPGHPTLLDSGHYAEQINRYRVVFGDNSIRVFLFDDFVADTAGTVEQVFSYIGADEFEVPDLRPQNQAAPRGLATFFQSVGNLPFVDRVPYTWRNKFKMTMRRVFARPKVPMQPSTRQWLRDYYRQHNEQLQKLLNRDLSHWQ